MKFLCNAQCPRALCPPMLIEYPEKSWPLKDLEKDKIHVREGVGGLEWNYSLRGQVVKIVPWGEPSGPWKFSLCLEH